MGCATSLAFVNKKNISIAGEKLTVVKDLQRTDVTITDEDKVIIKRQWRILSNDMKCLGAAVFLQIFKEHPEVKQLFPCRDVENDKLLSSVQFKRHAFRFMQAVAAVVDNIDNLENSMTKVLIDLGEQHVLISGIKPSYFEDFYNAICKVWKCKLGWRYKKECETAWNHVFTYIKENMKQGYNSASIKKDC